MRAVKAARKFIAAQPENPAAKVLADLVLSLENESSFRVSDIYTLDPEEFDLALRVLSEWRLDRFYLGKAKLFDVSLQHRDLRTTGLDA